MDIFKLVGSVFVDTESANSSLSKTDEKAGSVAKTLGSTVGAAAKVGTAIMGAATVAGGAIMGLANQTAETADVIDKASIRMGISTDYYQQLAYAAGQSGVEMSALEKAAKKLEGTDLNMEGALQQIMALGTAEERAQKASELFGDSIAYTLSPLIEQSGESFDGLLERANELGIVMSEDAVKGGVALGDTLDDIKKSFNGMVNQLGSAVMPLVLEFAQMLVGYMPAIQEMIAQIVPVFASLAESVMPFLMELVKAVLPVLMKLVNALMPVFNRIASSIMPIIIKLLDTLMPPLMQIIDAILPPLMQILDALMPLLELGLSLLNPLLQVILALITPLIELATGALAEVTSAFSELMVEVLTPLMPIIEQLASLFAEGLGVAIKGIKPVIDSAITIFKGLISYITGVFTGNWKRAWQGVIDIFKGVFSGLVNVVKVPLNAIITAINKVFEGIGEIKVPDWVPAIGGASFSLPKLPMLAKGGIVQGAGAVIVGENGPELLDLPRGAIVQPLPQKGAEIDYNKLTECFIYALETVAPDLKSNVTVSANTDRIFKVMQDKARDYTATTGRGAFA